MQIYMDLPNTDISQIQKLPEEFRPIFWDYNFDLLDKNEFKDVIIIRLYTKGGIRGMAYAEQNYTLEEITHAARTCRNMDVIVANFLKNKCGLREEDMAFYHKPLFPGAEIWG